MIDGKWKNVTMMTILFATISSVAMAQTKATVHLDAQ